MTSIFSSFKNGTTEHPFVVAQLGQSLDGRIATVTGDSKYINGEAALDHLHQIRAHVDAVVVGIGTVLADDPMLTVRRGAGNGELSNPARVVIDPRGRLPHDAVCLNGDDNARRLVIRREGSDTALPAGVEALDIAGSADADAPIAPDAIVAALGRAGFRRILIEGGAYTISDFIRAGCIDRLHMLVAPVLIGSGKPGLTLPVIEKLTGALRPETQAYLLEGGDVLFDCDLRRQRPG
jgi:diaminohydroxyphosphoribosylaminopyrimidine deaminase/5-amino-6-(5-phosphoribosylamino)uracil reductase